MVRACDAHEPERRTADSVVRETSLLLHELKDVDVNSLFPIEVLNGLFEWQEIFTK